MIDHLTRDAGSASHEISVPVTTFANIARDHDLRHVDYLSIDVEGAEFKVLCGIDFAYTDIAVFSIENPPSPKAEFAQIREFMKDRGYRLIRTLRVDDIFTKR